MSGLVVEKVNRRLSCLDLILEFAFLSRESYAGGGKTVTRDRHKYVNQWNEWFSPKTKAPI